MKLIKKVSLVAGVIVLAAAIPGTFAMASAGSSLTNCTRSQLALRSNGTQGALGTIYGAWVLTNVSSSKCLMNGYPEIHLYGLRGRPMGLTVQDDLKPGPAAVTLSPGGSATFRTSYSDVPSSKKGCQVSSVIQVTAPNATASLFIPAQLGPCRGILNVSAVESGVHGP